MGKLKNYKGSVEVIAGIKQKNDGDFPLMEAHSIQTSEDGKRLDDTLEQILNNINNPLYNIATEDQARAGEDDTVIMTPLKVRMACEEFGGSSSGVNVNTIASDFKGGSFSYGESIDIIYTFASPNRGNGTLHVIVDSIESINQTVAQGQNMVSLPELSKGNHTVTMYVVDRKETFSNTLSFNIKIGTLDISSNFNDQNDFNIINVIKVPITVDTISIEPIVLVQTIDSVEIRLSVVNGYNIITLPRMSAGAHKVTFYAESGSYRSQTLSYNIIIEDADNLTLISDFDTTSIKYRSMLELPYRVSLKGETKFIAKYLVDNTIVKELEIPSGTNVWSTNTLTMGSHILTIEVSTKDGSKSSSLQKNITVEPIDYTPLEPINDASLLCWFDATGRTNQDINKEVWEDKSGNETVATLHNFNFNTNGWEDNALKCNGQAYVDIDLKALEDNAPYGLTVDIRYNTRDVGNQDACVLDMRGDDTYHRGFAVDTQYMYMNSSSNSLKSTVQQESISRATFVIDRDNGIAKIYNNGVMSETFLLSESDNFTNDTKVYLGTKLDLINSKWQPNIYGNCDIYSFRVYARPLESEEIVTNFIADIPDMDEQQQKYLLNYENSMPTMYFYGDTSAMTKANKIPLRVKYISGDVDKYGASFDLENCLVCWQGTSSLQYAVKNYKIKLKNPDGSKYKYTPFKDGILEDTFTLKADYMESSHANNTGLAKFINNELYDEKIPPQLTNDKCRTTIDGFPIQLYIAKNAQATPEYIGVFNFNLDKGCNKTFGLDNTIEGQESCMSFEVSSNSDISAGAFRDDSDESIRTDFELRYPDEDDCTEEEITEKYNTIKRLVTWVKNADEETFKNELDQYFNKEYLLKYFLQVHTFGMVDNLGKNMMLTTWDGLVWYPEFYDLDTCLGLDNTGYLKFYSDIDIIEGVYNTSNSKLWTLVRSTFDSELKTMYKNLRTSKFRPEVIFKYLYDEQIAKIGELQYNKDMEAKYIKFKNDYLFMLHGRRSEHMRRWVSERLLYLDTIYGYEEDTRDSITIRANTTKQINLDIHTYSPQYLTVRWRNGVEQKLKIGRDSTGSMKSTRFSGQLATATDQEIIIYNAKQIKKIDGLANTNPGTLNLVEASRLVEIDCQNAKLLNDIRINDNNKFLSKIKLNGCELLGDTSTGKSSTLDLSMFPMLSEVNINNTKLTNVLFPTTGCNLKALNASSQSLQTLVLKNMPLLEYLLFSNIANFSDFTIDNCPNIILQHQIVNGFKKNVVYINAENVIIQNSPNIFKNTLDELSINCTIGYGVKQSIPILKKCIITDAVNSIPLLKICGTGSSVSYKATHISDFKIDVETEVLCMYGMGFNELQDPIDINMQKIKYFILKRFCNVNSVYLNSNLKGVYLGMESVGEGKGLSQTYSNGFWYTATCYGGTSQINSNYDNFEKINNIYIDNELVNNVIDFSKNPKMGILVLDEECMPSSINKVIINCDFSESKNDWRLMYNSNTVRFYIPVSWEVEGYLKTTTNDKLWTFGGNSSTTASTSTPPPLEDWDNLSIEFDKDIDVSNLFNNFINLKELPDTLTPEVINNSTTIFNMLNNCINLVNLNKIDGADIEITVPDGYIYDTVANAFCNVKGPFSLGNFTVNSKNSIYPTSSLFRNSGLTKIGNITFNTNECSTYASIFENCTKLESVGNVVINSSKQNKNMQRMFNRTPLLKSIGSLNIEQSEYIQYMFEGCGLSDYSNIQFPNNSNIEGMFLNSNLNDITTINNYREIIDTALNLNKTFSGTKITVLPDISISNTKFCNNTFSNTELINVGSIIINTNISNMYQLFNGSKSLNIIDKLDFKNIIFDKNNSYRDIINQSAIGSIDMQNKKLIISYADFSNLLVNYTHESGNNSLTALFIGGLQKRILSIHFYGTIGTGISYTNLFSDNICDSITIESFAECALSLNTPFTLYVGKHNIDLFTSDILEKLSAKNWTIAA